MDIKRGIRGVTPVVATTLLVGIVIVIALIVFFWFRSLKDETCLKFEQNIELVCKDVEFFADYDLDLGDLYVSNTGNVPIFGMKIKIEGDAGFTTFDLNEYGWLGIGLNQGNAFSGNILSEVSGNPTSITLIPTLMGSCGSDGNKIYICNEENYGYKIPLAG